MNRLLLFACVLISISAFAGDIKYPISEVPQSLQKGANVVKRMENIEFQINNTGETIYRRRYALTILNENGDGHAAFLEYYDKLRQITSIEGALYDKEGKLIKKLKSKEVQDLSAVDNNNLIDDSRRKFHHFYYRVYPYTVEYYVEQKFNNTLFFPLWLPQEDEDFSVQQSSYTVICPSAYDIRFRAFNYPGQPVTTTEKGMKKMQWKVDALTAFKVLPFSPSWKELTTMVFFAPTNFEIQGYKGNMSTWQDFGKFQNSLNAGRDVLPAHVVQKVASLTSGLTDVREKITVLYHYLQKNTRYISIQLGLGGWQPFEAADVAKNGYGDCKALTNYMYSLLKAAGIRANYTLVYAGDNTDVLVEDFPSNRFNHVILCVPLQKDSMWLECTSQTLPAGYMSDFTANRKALMITENGGAVVRTPRYGLKENVQLRTIKGKLDALGTLQMAVETKYGGLQQDNVSSLIHALSKEKVQEVLQRGLSLSTYDINDFKYVETKGIIPEVDEKLDVTVRSYATVSGKRIFIAPNILNRGGNRLDHNDKRSVDFVFEDEFHDEDRVEIEIPEGYTLEVAPKNVTIKSAFGSYTATAKLEGDKIIYTRIREQSSARLPASAQKEVISFFEDIYKADRSKIVLVKKES
jgi:hypothetical protein